MRVQFWQFAAVKQFQQIVGQRCVEIVGDPDFTARESHGPLCGGLRGNQPGYGNAGAGDRDFLSGCDPLEQAREVSLGLVDIYFHDRRLD